MSSQHVRPLVAFLLVSAICAVVMIHAGRAAGLGPGGPGELAIARGMEQPAQGGDDDVALGSLPGPASAGVAEKPVAIATDASTTVESGHDVTSATTVEAPGDTSRITPPSAHQPTTTKTSAGGTSTSGAGPTRRHHAAKTKRIARAQHIRDVAKDEYAARLADARSQRQLTEQEQSREVARARFARQIAKAKDARDAALERAREVAAGPADTATVAEPMVETPDADAVSSDSATVDPASAEPVQ